jgi:hypothetical protein
LFRYITVVFLCEMKTKILIVEDQFIEAKSLNVILTNAGYNTCTIARSVDAALTIIEKENQI